MSGAENVYPIEVEDVLASARRASRRSPSSACPTSSGARSSPRSWSRATTPTSTQDELKAYARERLAGYKLPRRLHVVDELPKTPTGKVLKRELRDQRVISGRRRRA